MGKKKGGAKGTHPTRSFADLVSTAQTKQLQPYVEGLVQQYMRGAETRLARQQITYLADPLVRLSVVEDVMCEQLKITKDDLRERFAVKEDEAQGYEKFDGPAQEGDKVRFTVESKNTEDGEYRDSTRIIARALNKTNSDGLAEHHNDLEAAMVGKSAGESAEVVIENPNADGAKFYLRATVDRVSRRIEAKEASNESENA